MHLLKKKRIARRTLLRGLGGAAIALPLLEAMAGVESMLLAPAHAAEGGLPRYFYASFFSNGSIPRWWNPIVQGEDTKAVYGNGEFSLNKIMHPLKGLEDKLTIVRGLDNVASNDATGCGGRHTSAVVSWLTGAKPKSFSGGIWEPAGPSLDQVIGARLAPDAPFQALNCGLGERGSYTGRISAKDAHTYVDYDAGADDVYKTLFSLFSQDSQTAQIQAARRLSVLDRSREGFDKLSKVVSAQDTQRIKAHLESIREVEGKIQRYLSSTCDRPDETPYKDLRSIRNGGDYTRGQETTRLIIDLIVLAMSCGSTQVATLANIRGGGGTNLLGEVFGFKKPGQNDPGTLHAGVDAANKDYEYHELSHLSYTSGSFSKLPDDSYKAFADPTKPESLPAFGAVQQRWMLADFRYFIDQAMGVEVAPGVTLFDRTLALIGSEFHEGGPHSVNDIPFLLAGDAGGRIPTGRYLNYLNLEYSKKHNDRRLNRPHNQLLVSVLQAMGLEDVKEFGSPTISDGALPGFAKG